MKKEVDSIIDGHKFHLHPTKIAGWKELNDCYPIHVEIGVTNNCNQNCVFCALDFARGKTDIDTNVMLKALKDMAHPSMEYKIKFEYRNQSSIYYDRVKSVMFGGEGEPTLHKDLGLFVQKAKEYGLDVALTTNGMAFNKELQEQCLPHLSWIKYSIDSGTAKTYGLTHGVRKRSFEALMKNISYSTELKRKNKLDVTIGTQFVMIPQNTNEDEAREIIRRLNEVKPDYLSVKPYSDHPRSRKDLIVDQEVYNNLEDIFNQSKSEAEFKIEFRKATIDRMQGGIKYSECYGSPFISLINSKGDIIPCNLFYDMEEFIYGNIYENSFSEIWGGDKRKDVLDRLKNKGTNDCRRGCRSDPGNLYLNRLKNPELHDNFT